MPDVEIPILWIERQHSKEARMIVPSRQDCHSNYVFQGHNSSGFACMWSNSSEAQETTLNYYCKASFRRLPVSGFGLLLLSTRFATAIVCGSVRVAYQLDIFRYCTYLYYIILYYDNKHFPSLDTTPYPSHLSQRLPK